MKKILKLVAIGAGVLVLLVVAILAVGAMLPADHVASASAVYRQPQDDIWRALIDYESFPAWRSGVDRVESRTFDGNRGWVEYGPMGPMPLAVEQVVPPSRLVLRIASDELPFGGTWTYELQPVSGGTRLMVTEDGTVSNLFFRFMARFVFGYTATMEAYLIDLGEKFGEQVTPQVVQAGH